MRIYLSLSGVEELAGLKSDERVRRERLAAYIVNLEFPHLMKVPVLLSVLGAILAHLAFLCIRRALFGESAAPGAAILSGRLFLEMVILCIGATAGGLIGVQFVVPKFRDSLRRLFSKGGIGEH